MYVSVVAPPAVFAAVIMHVEKLSNALKNNGIFNKYFTNFNFQILNVAQQSFISVLTTALDLEMGCNPILE